MRLAIIADVHGNLPALEAVLADVERRGVDRIVNLGDCASGPLWPRETCERLITTGITSIRGNHDRWVASLRRDDMGVSDRYAFDELAGCQREWLGQLAPTIEIDTDIIAFHATPDDDNRYLLEDIEQGRLVAARPETVARRLGSAGATIVLCGHSHQQHMMQLPGGPLVINPGSVGCPAYEDPEGTPHVFEAGSPHARYALTTTGDAGLIVDLIAIEYDHMAAVKRARANDRPEWAHGLERGFMPRR